MNFDRDSGGGSARRALSVSLDRTSGLPLYHQLAQQIKAAIEAGRLSPGNQLGNEIRLAERFGVSRPTMRRAVQELVDDGLLVRKRGVGTQVVQGPIDRPVRLTSLYDDLAENGQSPQTTVLLNEWIAAPTEVAAKLGLPAGQMVLHLRRLRFARQEPLAILENYLPNELAGIGDKDLSTIGLYQAMRQARVRLALGTQRIGARDGTAVECELLGEPAGSPVLTVDRLTLTDSGRPVEWAQHVFRPSRYAITITVTR
jgi:DNA-binding GntR family transcriptional regulator